MSASHGGGDLELLVAAGSRSFGSAVADAVEGTARRVTVSIDHVDGASTTLETSEPRSIDGAIVDGAVAEPVAVVERLADEHGLTVVVLTDSSGEAQTIPRTIEAGAADVFPRTTASAQYDLIVERFADDPAEPLHGTDRNTNDRPYHEVFENVSDGLLLHDPTTGEILEVNERYCEMTGYDRDELVGESVSLVIADEGEYTQERAQELIRRARDEGPQQFEWRNRHKDGHTYPVGVHLTLVDIDGAERVLASVWDITERKRREREYEQIFNMAGDGIVIHDPDSGDVVDANQQVADLLGYDREAFFDRPLSEFQSTDENVDEGDVRARIRESAETGPREFEWPLETSDGETVWVRARHETGEIDGEQRIVALLHDITERKRREREFEQIFDGVNDAIAIHHPDTGELLRVNRQLCELTGYDRERVLELGAEGLVHDHPDQDYGPDDIPGIIDRVLDGDDVSPYEQALETSDGDVVWVEVNPTRAVIDGEDRFLAISRDITERRRREQEYEQIFDNVEDAIVIYDPDTLDLVTSNEAYLDLFGYESQDALREQGVSGLSVTEKGYTEERGLEVVQRAVENDRAEVIEWQAKTRGGERIWLEVKVAPGVIGGEQRAICINRDITERKRREQRLEVFNRILRHNLRNQLDVIRSHAETLAERARTSHADRIIAAVDELAAIGAQARETDRIMSMDDSPSEIDLTAVLRRIVEEIEPTHSDVAVTTDLPATAPVRTSDEAVTIAVESALENALEYADSSVTVTITDSPEGYVVSLNDDGPGISEEELLPIERGTETTHQHGRGLGLWQLRWSVNKLNGELSFETDDGTTVRIAIPDRRESGSSD